MKVAVKTPLWVALGLAITLVSGLFPSLLSHILLGAVHYGAPLAWITQVIYPNAPKIYHFPEFLFDVAFWTLVSYLGYRVYKRAKD
jgi:hypothetical protein